MEINREWHSENGLPTNPTLDQRVKWHIAHARHCPCPPADGEILEELKKRYLNTHQEFWIFYQIADHQALALWAAECAERVLPFFAEKYPHDPRPQEAIRILREWVHTGRFSMPVIRGASLAAHAAARAVKAEEDAARFAARAAGQAVATAHVPTHAFGPVYYALKAIAAAHPADRQAAVAQERAWQAKNIPESLREWVVSGLKQNQRA
jgi:hypothetical protein